MHHAVQTWTELAAAARNSAASCQLDAADAADGHCDGPIMGQGFDHVERIGFDRRPAVAAVRSLAAPPAWGPSVSIHTHDGVDGVDEREGVGAAVHRRPPDGGDISHVGRQLHHDRNGGGFP